MDVAKNRTVCTFAAFWVFWVPLLAPAEQPEDADATVIHELETQLSAAVVKADAVFFDGILAEDFTHSSHAGRFRDKKQWMADLRREGAKYTSFKTEDAAVRLYGDTAIVTGRSLPNGTNSRGQAITGQYRYLRVWARRGGRWQAVAFQGTRIEKAASVADSHRANDEEK